MEGENKSKERRARAPNRWGREREKQLRRAGLDSWWDLIVPFESLAGSTAWQDCPHSIALAEVGVDRDLGVLGSSELGAFILNKQTSLFPIRQPWGGACWRGLKGLRPQTPPKRKNKAGCLPITFLVLMELFFWKTLLHPKTLLKSLEMHSSSPPLPF